MNRKARCNHETARLLQAKTPCVGKVEGKRAVIEANAWESTAVTAGEQHYVTAQFIQEGGMDHSADGLPEADNETQAILDSFAWGNPW